MANNNIIVGQCDDCFRTNVLVHQLHDYRDVWILNQCVDTQDCKSNHPVITKNLTQNEPF